MAEKELSKYIYDKLIENSENFQWKIVINSYKNAVEIYFSIKFELEENEFVQDVNAQVNESKQMYFEDVVCFYDQDKNRVIPENYLCAIPMDNSTGIEQGYVDAFLKQLNIVITSARSQLKEFLRAKNQLEFSLSWNQDNFKNTVSTLRKTQKYSTNLLNFSVPTERSLINQLKEEQYDGLERI